MNKDFVEFLKNNMSGTALRSLDNKIYDLYRLSHEYEDSNDDPIKRATTAIQRFGKISDSEVVTPQRIAKEMVDLIPEDDFKKVFESGNKFLDIASKMGEFAVAIYRRAESLGVSKEVIKNSIYSIPTSNIAYEFTRFIYEKLDLSEENLARNFNAYDLLTFGDDKIDYETITKFLKQNKSFNSIKIGEKIIEGDEIVNFDVVLGNPPYQVSDGGAQASARPIYHNFVDISKKIEPSFMTLIMPTRWYAGGKGLDEFRNDMLNDTSIAELHDFLHPEEVFPDTNNRGGVCYLLWDYKNTDENSSVRVVSHQGEGVVTTATRKLKYRELDIFIRYSQAIDILEKIFADEDIDTLNNHISAAKAFGFRTFFINDPKFRKTNSGLKNPVVCYGRGGNVGYVEDEEITSHREWIDNWKVYVPESNNIGTELNDDNQNSFVGAPKTICTETYLVVGADQNLNEVMANNLAEYLRTRFARFLLSLAKISQHGTGKTYQFIPVQDFSRAWTDADLYAKYGLTDEEIAFIESMIKPME